MYRTSFAARLKGSWMAESQEACSSLQMKSFSTLDNACLSSSFTVFQTNIHPQPLWHYYSIYKSLLPNVRHMPRGMSYNLWSNIRWGGARWSDCTGDPQTVNKDQTMLSAAWFKQNVFITLPAQRIVGQTTDASEIINNFRFCFQEECCRSIFCHYVCLLWYLCFPQLCISIPRCLSCRDGHSRWWRFSRAHNVAFVCWNHFFAHAEPPIFGKYP